MDFALPQDLVDYLGELDRFIEAEIKPLEQADDNIRFFDHRREHARTDWDAGGLPRKEWEALLAEARRRADAAGHLRYAWPVEWGGKGGSNLAMAILQRRRAPRPRHLCVPDRHTGSHRRDHPGHLLAGGNTISGGHCRCGCDAGGNRGGIDLSRNGSSRRFGRLCRANQVCDGSSQGPKRLKGQHHHGKDRGGEKTNQSHNFKSDPQAQR